MILDHIPHHQIFIRHEVVRPHHAPCCLNSKVLTLATYFEVFTSKFISQLNSVLGTLFSLRHPALQPSQRLLTLAKVSRISDCFPVTIGVEVVQSNINTNSFTRWFSPFYSFMINAKLAIIAVCTTHNPHSFELFELIEMQVTGSPKFEGSCFKSVSKGDVPAVIRKFPSRGFVLNRTMCLVLLKLWKSLFTWLTFFAIIKKSSDCRPRSFSTSLSCHRVEFGSIRKLRISSKHSAICAQLVFTNAFIVHPVSNATVTNKTSSADSFIQLSVLLVHSFQFCFKYQHFYAKLTSVIITQKLLKSPLFSHLFCSAKRCFKNVEISTHLSSPPYFVEGGAFGGSW
ncbi:hypothetical protein NSP_9610 [Nodularia spumigena CCY9414]|nr:hypothetical protein NSP_9610 [Nodularia spumigena CCY9414]